MLREHVIIYQEKCTGCGLCSAICPYRAIAMVDDKAEHSGIACFLCGHCYAVCPVGAVSLPDRVGQLGLATIEEISQSLAPGKVDGPALIALMRSRRSCRQYLERQVPLEFLADLVKIGTTAPSGTNSQGWNFTILPTRDDLLSFGTLVGDYYRKLNRLAANPLLRGLMKLFGGDSLGRYYRQYFTSVSEAIREWDEQGHDRLFHGATAAILVTGQKNASCPAEDALLATGNILLAAHAMGLGSCLIGFAVEAMRRAPEIKTQLEIPDSEEMYSVIVLGFPSVTFSRPACRKDIRPRIVKLAGS